MVKRVLIQVVLGIALAVVGGYLAKDVLREDRPRSGKTPATQPSQEEVAKQRLRSLGYLN